MAAAAVATSNGGAANGPTPGRLASVYSEVQTSRIAHALPLPSVLRSHFTLADGPASSAAGNPGEQCPPLRDASPDLGLRADRGLARVC
jgi:pyrophosphate--fructose-6-phosphate 1-phosphotransferase